jgi:hypothetical protein
MNLYKIYIYLKINDVVNEKVKIDKAEEYYLFNKSLLIKVFNSSL